MTDYAKWDRLCNGDGDIAQFCEKEKYLNDALEHEDDHNEALQNNHRNNLVCTDSESMQRCLVALAGGDGPFCKTASPLIRSDSSKTLIWYRHQNKAITELLLCAYFEQLPNLKDEERIGFKFAFYWLFPNEDTLDQEAADLEFMQRLNVIRARVRVKYNIDDAEPAGIGRL